MASIKRFIETRLRLKVNEAKSAVARPEERHFLGFRLSRKPEDGTTEVNLSKRSTERIDRRICEMTPRNWGNELGVCIDILNVYLRGWLAYFGICTDEVVRKLHNLDAHVRRRLRAVLLKQWKRPRTIVRNLIQRGVSPPAANAAVHGGRKSIWALSIHRSVHRALPNAWFVEQGLVSLESAGNSTPHVVLPQASSRWFWDS
jgi:hypothetical protein